MSKQVQSVQEQPVQSVQEQSIQSVQEQPLLDIRGLSIAFGGLKAVDNLSFQINEGEIYGLIGPNGAGKTTVFNCITQFYKPDAGEILFRNKQDQTIDLTTVPSHEVIRHGVVRTFQNVELIRELSILENVLIGGHIDFKQNYFDELLNLPRRRREEKELTEKAREILQFLGIDELRAALAGAQPYGIQKKVELARTLMAHPKLIILDEPAAGLHEQETYVLADEIMKIRDEYDATILLVEHDMKLVMRICDRISAISFGKLLATGTSADIQRNQAVQEAYLGVDT